MTEKVFKELIAQLEEAAVHHHIHKNDAWINQLDKSREKLLHILNDQQKEIKKWKARYEIFCDV